MSDSDGLIRPGSPAPDFTLPATPDGRRTGPGQFRDRPVVLAKGIRFPLLADFEPKGEVARRYGAYTPAGQAARALVVIDPAGTVAWSYLSPAEVNPGAGGILDALEQLGTDRRVVAG